MAATPPPGYDPTLSSLPDPGAAAVPMKAMMGGGVERNRTATYTTVTILGEPYRIRLDVQFPLEREEERLLDIFLLGPEAQRRFGKDALVSFFHALTHYNCEKEEGVLLNPKCEPVRAVLRAALMKSFLHDVDTQRGKRNLGPLRSLLNEDMLKRRNHIEAIEHLTSILPGTTESVLDRLLKHLHGLKERYKVIEDDTILSAVIHHTKM
jgi:hypothetical protein